MLWFSLNPLAKGLFSILSLIGLIYPSARSRVPFMAWPFEHACYEVAAVSFDGTFFLCAAPGSSVSSKEW